MTANGTIAARRTRLRRTARRLKRVLEAVRAPHRRHVFHRAMRQILELPDGAVAPKELVLDLIYGWGFVSGSMKHEYAAAMLEHAVRLDGPILECGSGVSTIVLGVVAQRRGIHVWSLEHNAYWAKRVRATLGEYEVASVTVCERPLRDYGGFSWYDPPLSSMPRDFALVVCDGPPACVGSQTPGGRYGLLPVMANHLRPGCVILLDDAERPGEQQVLARWAAELGSGFRVEGVEKPFGVVVIPPADSGRGTSSS